MPWKMLGGSEAADQKLFFYVLVTQSRPALCNPVDCSPPGSSLERISQARIVEWVAISSSRGSSRPRDQTQVSYVSCRGRWVLFRQRHLGSPRNCTWKRLSLPLGSQASKTFYKKRACAQGEGGGGGVAGKYHLLEKGQAAFITLGRAGLTVTGNFQKSPNFFDHQQVVPWQLSGIESV